MSHFTSDGPIIDQAAFEAYKELREIANKFNVEDKLEVPQLVIVGETSTGKSMLVQYFLRFPCSFSKADVATRCPVAYSLRYNPNLRKDERRVIRPTDTTDSNLANYLEKLMKRIEVEHAATGGFRVDPELIEIESAEYTDFEILDVPGFVGGDHQAENRQAVEKIAESFVRNPRFAIVFVKEATQVSENSHGARIIYDLCNARNAMDPKLQPRPNYRENMITIHTKFDSFMLNYTNGKAANEMIRRQLDAFGPSYFTNMIFGGYSINEKSFADNVAYIRDLPHKEQQEVDKWIANMNRTTDESAQSYEPFDTKYRSLIGIDVVRKQIQALWLRSFRVALPKLKGIIAEQLEAAQHQYNEDQERYKLLNPKLLQDQYLKYLNDFRTILRQYVGYKSEVDFNFPIEIYGQTYDEIEADYFQWKRRKQVTWRAYISAINLRERFKDEHTALNARLVGGRHFSRLHNVFSRMILSYKADDPSHDWIETAASHLSANSTDFDDMEKAARDILRTLIRRTFLIGICWLTQMYSYLLDSFRIKVKQYLLNNDKYSFLRAHYRFLNVVDLEYHIITRSMIHDAVRLIRDIRNSTSAYAHYDITIRMLKLVFSIPPEIKHEKFKEPIEGIFIKSENSDAYTTATLADIFKSIPPPQLLEQIYGSESFLTDKRNPYTGSHHGNQCRAIQELYTAVCGRLLQDIQSSFNSNVVMKIHNVDRLDTEQQKEKTNRCSLYLRISRMTDQQISDMANVNLDEINEACHNSIEQITALSKANSLIDIAIQQMISDQPMRSEERQKHLEYMNMGNQKRTEYLRKKQETLEKQNRNQFQSQTSHSHLTDQSEENQNYIILDEEHELMTIEDPTLASIFLSEIYHKHDLEDLTHGFLDGDSLDQDKNNHAAHNYLHTDPDAIYYTDPSSTSTAYANHRYKTINNNASRQTTFGSSVQNPSEVE